MRKKKIHWACCAATAQYSAAGEGAMRLAEQPGGTVVDCGTSVGQRARFELFRQPFLGLNGLDCRVDVKVSGDSFTSTGKCETKLGIRLE